MGGGSSSSQESQQQTTQVQKDTTSTGGGVTVGADGLYYAVDQSIKEPVGENAAVASGNGNTVESVTGTKVTIGNGSSAIFQQMDQNTADVLLGAVSVLGTNTNNFMSLAAGRDPDKPLADENTVTQTLAEQPDEDGTKKTFIQKNAGLLTVVLLAAAVWFAVVVFKKKRKK